jgi:hypothetical protein
MKAKNFVILQEIIIGTQLITTGIILGHLGYVIAAVYLIIIGCFFFFGGGEKLIDLKYGKGNWEDKEL